MKNLNLALIVACVTAICLNAEVLTKTADISMGGKKIGKIEVLTPVEVIAKDGAKAKRRRARRVTDCTNQIASRRLSGRAIYRV